MPDLVRDRRLGRETWRSGAMASPRALLALLILTTTIARVVFANAIGLGVDESYVVAAGRQLQAGYFDHPPLTWWLVWASGQVFHSEAPVVVRFPFIALFACSTWLMYRLTAELFGPRAGLWAAAAFNAAPIFGLADGAWVLPDGPMITALLGMAFCLARALPARAPVRWGWWLGAGACAGLALFSKYIAILPCLGAACFALSEPRYGRGWLRRPAPYVAALLAGLIFSPVVFWNAQHHWASFLFQGGRGGGRVQPFGPLVSLVAQAVFLTPWIWIGVTAAAGHALRGGVGDPRRWLMLCLGAPCVLAFLTLSAWGRVLPHWGCPGYVLLFPLLGDEAARAVIPKAWLRFAALAGAALFVACPLAAGVEARTHWGAGTLFAKGSDPDRALDDWGGTAARIVRLQQQRYPGAAVGALHWFDAGKIDYALHGALPVVCLSPDRREYGLTAPLSEFYGRDILILAPRQTLEQVRREFGPMFQSIELTDARPAEASSPEGAKIFLGRALRV